MSKQSEFEFGNRPGELPLFNGGNEMTEQERARELAECQSYIISDIPAGADATNDYWRRRVAELSKQ